MSDFITECPGCGDTKIFGRMGEWWCSNLDCAVKWGNENE